MSQNCDLLLTLWKKVDRLTRRFCLLTLGVLVCIVVLVKLAVLYRFNCRRDIVWRKKKIKMEACFYMAMFVSRIWYTHRDCFLAHDWIYSILTQAYRSWVNPQKTCLLCFVLLTLGLLEDHSSIVIRKTTHTIVSWMLICFKSIFRWLEK